LKHIIKHIGSFALLLAGVIILAHALVAHHEHDGQPFFEASECHHQHQHESADQSSTCDHNHSDGSAGDCALHQMLVLPGKQIRAEQPVISNTLLNNYCALFVHEYLTSDLDKNASEWFFHIDGTIPLPSRIYASVKGLRAPPLV
jgi:hypothetical protein